MNPLSGVALHAALHRQRAGGMNKVMHSTQWGGLRRPGISVFSKRFFGLLFASLPMQRFFRTRCSCRCPSAYASR